MSLARKARRNAEPHQPHLAGRVVEQDVGRLDVFMDEPALVKLTQSRGNSAAEAQEAPYLQGPTEQPIDRPTARILEHQHGSIGFAHEVQRPHRPRRVEFVLQFVFVRQAIEA